MPKACVPATRPAIVATATTMRARLLGLVRIRGKLHRAQVDDVAGRDAADLPPGELHQQMAFAGDLDGPSRERLARQLHAHVAAQSRRRPPVVQQRASPAPGLDESAVVLLEAVVEPAPEDLPV